jgi:iduronate 2-sulfatase
MPAWFRQHGYTAVSVGKVSHHPGGRGGSDWDDDTQPEMPESWDRHLLPAGLWKHPRGVMHGLANGEIRKRAQDMALFQSTAGEDDIYPDGLIVNESLKQLDELAAAEKPFFLAVGIIRPHLPFGAPAKYMEHYKTTTLPPIAHPQKPDWKSTWHRSGEFMKYNRWGRDPNDDADFATAVRKHYAACVSYADAQVGRLLKQLDATGQRDNTIVVLWGDHGWHLGEHAIWGKHALFEESLRSPLIVSHSKLTRGGESTDAVVETLDIFPTLVELTELKTPDFINGVSLVPQLADPATTGHVAVSYKNTAIATIRSERYRLIRHKGDYIELYDHTTSEAETKNIADTNPEVVARLKAKLTERLSLNSSR